MPHRLLPLLTLLLLLGIAGLVVAAEAPAPKTPAKGDKCPVCGMFVAKYPDWTAQIAWKDGQTVFFDGVKDLLVCLFDLPRYAPGRSRQDVAAIYVTEYYAMTPIRAEEALFVVGSDVYGPMGAELIPFAGRADAEQFAKDHRGKRTLPFAELTPGLLQTLK
jgi:nitrous oxide reductase accessory protein NosL